MSHYTISLNMITMRCANCGVMFGVPKEFDQKRRDDGNKFYCPNGHCNVYRKTEADKLREQLLKTQRRVADEQRRALRAKGRADQLDKQYHRVRQRIMAGVCPCCNRTFQNVARHMATKHPELSPGQRLRTLRDAFGLIQPALAREACVSAGHVSQFENDRPVVDWARERIEEWLEAVNGEGK